MGPGRASNHCEAAGSPEPAWQLQPRFPRRGFFSVAQPAAARAVRYSPRLML